MKPKLLMLSIRRGRLAWAEVRGWFLGGHAPTLLKATSQRPYPWALSTLKWVGFLAPLAFASLYLYLATGVLHPLSRSLLGFLLLLGIVAAAIALFTAAIFGLVERLQKALVQQNREMEALLALGRRVANSLDMDEVLGGAAQAVVEATSAEYGEIWLSDEGRQQVVMRQGYGADAELFADNSTLKLGEGIPGRVAATSVPVAIHNLSADGRFLRQRVKDKGYHTYCAFPLRSRNQVVGVLALASRSSGALTEANELRLVEAMADHIAMAVDNALLHQRVQHLAVLTERERIARELHDGMAQVLTYVNAKTLAVERLLSQGDKVAASLQLQQLAERARQLYAEVREAILSLRSHGAGDSDLLSVLRRYGEEFEGLSGLSVCFQEEVKPEDLAVLGPIAEIQLLRIVQEALTNVRKHAQATRAWLTLRGVGEELEVVVRDDGLGFDPHQLSQDGWPRFGLQSMEERAKAIGGSLQVESQPGRGTAVILRLPRATPRN